MKSLSQFHSPAQRSSFRRKALITALSVVATFTGPLAQAVTPVATSWELANGFNDTTHGPVWSSGYKLTNNTFYPFASIPPASATCLSGWVTGLPIVAHNPALSSCTTGNLSLAPRAMLLHPGSAGESAVVRFKAPYSAQYHVSGQFYGIDANGSGTHTKVGIVATLSALTYYSPYSNTITLNPPSAAPSTASFTSFYVMLKAGQFLDFTVKAGAGNYYAYGSTGLNAVIERSGDWCGFVDPDNPATSTC